MPSTFLPYKMAHKNNHFSTIKPVAVLVDGGYFLKRYRRCYPNAWKHDPATVATNMHKMVLAHVQNDRLYRILFYDCPPLDKKAHNPITKRSIDFGKTAQARFRLEFHDELKRLRKVALRLGYLRDNGGWIISSAKTKELLKGNIEVDKLQDVDVTFDIRQKGVDMKIGLDIASLAYKKLVDRIILVSGDADFVPAAKLARREGIDFILDPMWKHVDPSLQEHIDGMKCYCPKPKRKKAE